MEYKYTIEDLQKEAEKRGGKCNSTEFNGVKEKYEFECAEGHKWSTLFANIQHGHWCPKCAMKNRSKHIKYRTRKSKIHDTIEDLQQYASDHGFKLLSTKYINTVTKYKWECAEKHISFKTWSVIKKHGLRCNDCYRLKQNSPHVDVRIDSIKPHKKISNNVYDRMKQYAKLKLGELLSTEYINAEEQYEWKCKRDHVWMATFKNAKTYWCKKCRKLEKRHYSHPITITLPKEQINSVDACKLVACKPARQFWLDFFIDHKWELRMIDYKKVYEGIVKMEEILYNNRCNSRPSVVVGTVVYLKSDLSQKDVESIMLITAVSIRNLLRLVKLKKEE